MALATADAKESEPAVIQGPQPCSHFEFRDIDLATENFDESLVIGHGGFGKVYKANIMIGSTSVVAAIKRLDIMSSSQGASEFWAEVETLSVLRHCNLVSLMGYCNHEKEMILVYEYMSNGTLEDHLYKLRTNLSWLQRLKICIGAGRGLHYLHTGTGIDSGVIHRDVKASNILLHESWAAKIADFGLSKIGPTNQPKTHVSTLVKGTFGYLDPDYYQTGKLTRKSDVYAFGVVMLELLCRRRALDTSLVDEEQWNLARWVQESIKKGNLKHIVDLDIRGEIAPKCLKEFVRIAQRCLRYNTKERLTMAEVLVGLENILMLQEKYNRSVQPVGRTLLGRMVDMLPFSSNGDNSAQGQSKLSSDNSERVDNDIIGAENNTLLDTTEHPVEYRISSLQEFKIDVLIKSTNGFSRDKIIGEGRFRTTYLGWVNENTFTPSEHGDGVAVAVRRLDYFQRHAKWQEELSFLGQLAHPNIVNLLGYCSDKSSQYLVFEYMPNKSFDRFIFRDSIRICKNDDINNYNSEPLSWGTRLKIMIGVARGLVYLHSLSEKFINGDLNGAHILLDEDFNAKLGCFSIPKIIPWDGRTRVISSQTFGTRGYTDPVYCETDRFSVKNDIYSFGVVLLETLTGLRVIDEKRPSKQLNLVDWARPFLWKRKKLMKIMDPRLELNYRVEDAFNCGSLALRCLASSPRDRPSSEEVLQTLEQISSNSIQ